MSRPARRTPIKQLMATATEGQQVTVTGWVRNLPDGSVEALAEGNDLEGFLAWCKKGPLVARVDRSDVIPEQNGERLTVFHIRTD